ncbi:four-carbon acid sugar kinase family protein [Agromyces sp. Soil535]|uniref:four-carbon acid sugar kinase family protein n=1 Tax=Agromyces sp. Soil535 TaxID=1736390 RepID=UPI0006F4879C|nr:four-carbon acid sugar kinase family protein [Agromyces sp. Soil535]KRE21834.1 hypothetical protein ASG80_12135 [Agromyces sp. Soil535]
MKLIVLDDDPTGTQSVTGVEVLLEWDTATLTETLRRADSVYLLTNTRAMYEADAVALLERIRDERDAAAAALGEAVHVVLRGDSTLRGHVFPETSVFAGDDAVILFVPAFPGGGRTTVDGTHYVRIGDRVIPAHESEYADDPVFPFGTAVLTEYVSEKSERAAVHVPLRDIRSTPTALQTALADAAPGTVVVPDAEHDDDIRAIAAAVLVAWESGVRVVVRSASPLAAELAGVASTGLLPTPLSTEPSPTLLVCGSHTIGATRQLELVERAFGEACVVDTGRALHDPFAEGERVAAAAEVAAAAHGLSIVASDRHRDGAHNTLDHGERVMTALTTATGRLRGAVDVVVSKGGITSAEIARVGLGARTATVLGQVLPGVSAWRIETPEHEQKLYVVVPGNVGDPSTLVDVLAAVGVRPGFPARHPELSASER